jgi:hypothetical protein
MNFKLVRPGAGRRRGTLMCEEPSNRSTELIRRRRTGEVSASSRRGHRPRKLTPVQEAALAAHVAACADMTLAATQSWLLA